MGEPNPHPPTAGGQKVKQVQHLFFGKDLSRRSPIEALTWTIVDKCFDLSDLLVCYLSEVAALWEEETNNIIDVFVGAALPRLMRLRFRASDRTLTDEEVQKAVEKVMKVCAEKHEAVIRG